MMVSLSSIKADHKPPNQEVEEVAVVVREAEVVTDHKLAVVEVKEVEEEEVDVLEREVAVVDVVVTEVAVVVMVKEEDNSSEEPQERDLTTAQKTRQEADSLLMEKTETQIRDHQEDQETRVEKALMEDMTERMVPAEVEEEISKVENSVRATKSREHTSRRELKLPPPLSQQKRPRRKSEFQLRMKSKSSMVSHSTTFSLPTH